MAFRILFLALLALAGTRLAAHAEARFRNASLEALRIRRVLAGDSTPGGAVTFHLGSAPNEASPLAHTKGLAGSDWKDLKVGQTGVLTFTDLPADGHSSYFQVASRDHAGSFTLRARAVPGEGGGRVVLEHVAEEGGTGRPRLEIQVRADQTPVAVFAGFHGAKVMEECKVPALDQGRGETKSAGLAEGTTPAARQTSARFFNRSESDLLLHSGTQEWGCRKSALSVFRLDGQGRPVERTRGWDRHDRGVVVGRGEGIQICLAEAPGGDPMDGREEWHFLLEKDPFDEDFPSGGEPKLILLKYAASHGKDGTEVRLESEDKSGRDGLVGSIFDTRSWNLPRF